MDLKELRVGSIVKYKFSSQRGHCFLPIVLNETHLILLNGNENYRYHKIDKDFLLKNGWKLCAGLMMSNNTNDLFDTCFLYENGVKFCFKHNEKAVVFCYVHELQNFYLKVMKKELKLKL